MKNNHISMLQKTVKTELIKKKKSGIFLLSIITGMFIPVVYFFIPFKTVGDKIDETGIPVNYFWEWISKSVEPFASFFFPLLIIIVASKIAQIDHKNRGWDLMETQPVSKFSIFFSKFVILLLTNILAIVSFLFFSLLSGYIFSLIHELGTDKIMQIPFYRILQLSFRLFAASLAITALQYSLSVVISKFIWPILIGFFGLMLLIFLSNLNIKYDWNPYYFLVQVGRYPDGSDFGYWITYNEILSVLFAVVFLYIGFNRYRFKTFFKAFLKSKNRVLKLIVVLLSFGVLIGYTLKPKQQKPYYRTVLSGTVETDQSIKTVYLFDALVRDTIAKIPVKNNTFHYVIKDELLPDYYLLQFEYFSLNEIFLRSNDSLNIKYQLFGNDEKTEVLGTRISENKQSQNLIARYSRFQYYLRNNKKIDDTEYYMKEIYEGWRNSIHHLYMMRTVDNLEPREDFKERLRKEINVFYLKFWNDFKKKHEALNPDKTYKLTEGIKELENSISFNDESLLTSKSYSNLISSHLIRDDKRDIDENSKQLEAVSKLDKGKFREKLMFLQLDKSMKEIKTIPERDSLFSKYIGFIETPSYRSLLQKKYGILNRLSKGMPAPQFKVYNTDKQGFTNESFKGKFLVLDIWASWCNPCLREAPYFESAAIKFKDQPVVFVSVSVDMIETMWIIAVKDKNNTVLQVRADNNIEFAKLFAIESIPRFILIDPEGNLVNVDFSRPSDDSFSELLNIYLKERKNN